MQEIHIEEKSPFASSPHKSTKEYSKATEDKNKNKTTFLVTVEESGSQTKHTVHVRRADNERIAPKHTPEELVWATFLFLLDNEPKESILSKFNLTDITTYFPNFEEQISEYLT